MTQVLILCAYYVGIMISKYPIAICLSVNLRTYPSLPDKAYPIFSLVSRSTLV